MKTTTKLLTMIIDLGTATHLTLGGFGEYLEFGFRPLQLGTKKEKVEYIKTNDTYKQ